MVTIVAAYLWVHYCAPLVRAKSEYVRYGTLLDLFDELVAAVSV